MLGCTQLRSQKSRPHCKAWLRGNDGSVDTRGDDPRIPFILSLLLASSGFSSWVVIPKLETELPIAFGNCYVVGGLHRGFGRGTRGQYMNQDVAYDFRLAILLYIGAILSLYTLLPIPVLEPRCPPLYSTCSDATGGGRHLRVQKLMASKGGPAIDCYYRTRSLLGYHKARGLHAIPLRVKWRCWFVLIHVSLSMDQKYNEIDRILSDMYKIIDPKKKVELA